MTDDVLIARDLVKRYARREVLQGASLSVRRGEFLSVMGESGSGKSTLLNILAGNLRPDGGSVLLNGREITRMNDRELAALRRRELGFVFQSLNLIGTLNVRDNILLPLVLDGADLRAGRERMRDYAEQMRVAELLDAFTSLHFGQGGKLVQRRDAHDAEEEIGRAEERRAAGSVQSAGNRNQALILKRRNRVA